MIALGFIVGVMGALFIVVAHRALCQWLDNRRRISRRLQKASTRLTSPNAKMKASTANTAIRISSSFAGGR